MRDAKTHRDFSTLWWLLGTGAAVLLVVMFILGVILPAWGL